ncbi:Crp/Fnr family transcriptional regulator [Aureivirga sp. CE67]|uniref:Crp/Fnr family transcriptional regulator n=1 Tax=Aureivirga sp. CE67 TaxID=1788983 RepID=UPI0018CBB268|nr:Crp/Fnr family transcriptional regulator [Aureivirga sp. CE67]
MKNVFSAIDKYYKLSDSSKKLIIDKLEPFTLKKGEILIHDLEKNPYLYFIEKGAVKTHYFNEEGSKKVVWFGFEGSICFSLSSYMNIDTDFINDSIELIEDCEFYRVKISYIKSLFKNHCDWANWGRSFIENTFVITIKEMNENKARSTKENYLNLIKNTPYINERVALKDIASYLGVSPVTLSRLRSEIEK